jgi:hypothetical protein
MTDEHEAGLAAFLLPERRERFRASLRDPRRRRKLYDELHHFAGQLDPRSATRHGPHVKHDAHIEEVHALLVGHGAPPTCFVLADTDLDGRQPLLREALASLMWAGAGFISCLPGRLGLYVGEDGSEVFVLARG